VAATTTCPHCGQRVEAATFCTNCGQPLTAGAPSDPPPPDDTQPEPDAPPHSSRFDIGGRAQARLGQARAGLVGALLPPLTGVRRERYRWLVAAGFVVALALLLLGRPGIAIAVAAWIVPALFLMYVMDVDVYEEESKLFLALTIGGGVLAGVLVGIVNTFFVEQLWIKHAAVNIGAAGFGDHFAHAAGFPPIATLLVSGIVVAALAEVVQLAMAFLLLRWRASSLDNEVMDGITLGVASGGAFAAVTAIYYYWPLITHRTNPGMGVAAWTATLLGLLLVRPLLFGTVAALIGAGIWRHALHTGRGVVLPIAAGLVGVVVASLGDLMVQPSGARAELLWLVIVLLVLGGFFRLTLGQALRQDRQTAAATGLVVCSHCHNLTPPSTYCVSCGQPLQPAAPAAPVTARPAADRVTEPPIPAPAPASHPAPPAEPTAPIVLGPPVVIEARRDAEGGPGGGSEPASDAAPDGSEPE